MNINIISSVLVIIGLIISLVGLPGVWLVFAAIALTAIISGFDIIPLWFLIVAFLISLFSGIVDNILLAAGAHKLGASKWGVTGAIVGGLVGLITANIIGIILGPFIGAVAFELFFAKKERDEAIKAGIGTFFGYCAGIFVKFLITLVVATAWFLLINR